MDASHALPDDTGWPEDTPFGPDATREAVRQGLTQYHAGEVHQIDLAPYRALADSISDDEE